MRLVINCPVAIALAVLLSGCSANYKMKGAERPAPVVAINNCQADPDTVVIHENDSVQWQVSSTDSHTYTVQFQRSPFAESTASVSNASQDKPHQAKRDFWCKTFGACKYAYTVTPNGGPVCPDPGVHVIP
jgi:hypothetical protein